MTSISLDGAASGDFNSSHSEIERVRKSSGDTSIASLEIREVRDSKRVSKELSSAKVVRPDKSAQYKQFRNICDSIISELSKIDVFLVDGRVSEDGLEVVVEVEHLLEVLYDVPWGHGNALKKLVALIQAQVNNCNWTANHVMFLRSIVAATRLNYAITEDLIDHCFELIEHSELDQFRGSVSAVESRKSYKLVEDDSE